LKKKIVVLKKKIEGVEEGDRVVEAEDCGVEEGRQ